MDNVNAVETADSNPGEPRQVAREPEVTITITVARRFAELVIIHPEEHADVMIGIVCNELHRALRADGPLVQD